MTSMVFNNDVISKLLAKNSRPQIQTSKQNYNHRSQAHFRSAAIKLNKHGVIGEFCTDLRVRIPARVVSLQRPPAHSPTRSTPVRCHRYTSSTTYNVVFFARCHKYMNLQRTTLRFSRFIIGTRYIQRHCSFALVTLLIALYYTQSTATNKVLIITTF